MVAKMSNTANVGNLLDINQLLYVFILAKKLIFLSSLGQFCKHVRINFHFLPRNV